MYVVNSFWPTLWWSLQPIQYHDTNQYNVWRTWWLDELYRSDSVAFCRSYRCVKLGVCTGLPVLSVDIVLGEGMDYAHAKIFLLMRVANHHKCLSDRNCMAKPTFSWMGEKNSKQPAWAEQSSCWIIPESSPESNEQDFLNRSDALLRHILSDDIVLVWIVLLKSRIHYLTRFVSTTRFPNLKWHQILGGLDYVLRCSSEGIPLPIAFW